MKKSGSDKGDKVKFAESHMQATKANQSDAVEQDEIHGAIEAIWRLMNEHAAQSAPKQSAGIWVKASERLSEHYVGKCCRLLDNPNYYFTAYYDNSTGMYCKGLIKFAVREIQWLDEGQQLQSQQQVAPKSVSADKRWVSTEAFVAACKAVLAISSASDKNGVQTIEQINTFQELLKEQGFSILPIAAQSAPKKNAGVFSEEEATEAANKYAKIHAVNSGDYIKILKAFKDALQYKNEGQQLQSQQHNLFQKKEVTLHSGEVSDWKIECDALTDEDLDCLAYLVSKKIEFSRVVGVPRGGDRFANALRKYRNYKEPPKGERSILILCDDVLTTGKSMEEKKQSLVFGDENPPDKIKGVVIFARGKCPDWVTPIFQMKPGT